MSLIGTKPLYVLYSSQKTSQKTHGTLVRQDAMVLQAENYAIRRSLTDSSTINAGISRAYTISYKIRQ